LPKKDLGKKVRKGSRKQKVSHWVGGRKWTGKRRGKNGIHRDGHKRRTRIGRRGGKRVRGAFSLLDMPHSKVLGLTLPLKGRKKKKKKKKKKKYWESLKGTSEVGIKVVAGET